MKGHFFFNAWTTCTMLAELLDVADGKFDLVIVDRGLFDALIWLELQRVRAQVEPHEERVFRQFVLLNRWRSLIDLSIFMQVRPKVAMQREQIGQLLRRRGSLMNPGALRAFNQALERTRREHARHFQLVRLEPTAKPKLVAQEVIGEILPAVTRLVDPDIVAVPLDVVRSVFGTQKGIPVAARGAMLRLFRHARPVRRSQAERDRALVQVVACGIPTHAGGAFVFDRERDEERREQNGKLALWRGTHIDAANGGGVLPRAAAAVAIRLKRDLHLQVHFRPKLLGIVHTRVNSRDEQHLGVVFQIPIEDDDVAESLEEKQFKMRARGHPATSVFVPIPRLRVMKRMEPWSSTIVEAGWLGGTAK